MLLNQVLLSVQRLPDPKATGYDFGFQIQALYGSDARYVQFMGELNSTFASRNQLAFINANVQAHLPWLTAGGIDLKVGQYPTPLGYETIDPSTNPFYSHSYIFNFGLPYVHTGAIAVTHVNPILDVYGGVDTGMNTTFGAGDNNGAVAELAGVNLTLLDSKLTILALSHFGPENPTRTVPKANCCWRSENDIVITYKATDKLAFTTELNLINDSNFAANAYGAAQYVSYALNDAVTLNARAEIYRDEKGFFVAAFPGNHGFINAQLGFPATVLGAGPATYSEFTLGLTYKPTLPWVLGPRRQLHDPSGDPLRPDAHQHESLRRFYEPQSSHPGRGCRHRLLIGMAGRKQDASGPPEFARDRAGFCTRLSSRA